MRVPQNAREVEEALREVSPDENVFPPFGRDDPAWPATVEAVCAGRYRTPRHPILRDRAALLAAACSCVTQIMERLPERPHRETAGEHEERRARSASDWENGRAVRTRFLCRYGGASPGEIGITSRTELDWLIERGMAEEASADDADAYIATIRRHDRKDCLVARRKLRQRLAALRCALALKSSPPPPRAGASGSGPGFNARARHRRRGPG